jgi:hypothetical protein
MNTQIENKKEEIDANTLYLQQEFDRNFIGSIEIYIPRYEALCVELAKSGNATDAYIKTHPEIKCQRKTASERVSRLLRIHPEIKARVAQISRAALKNDVLSLNEVLKYKTKLIKENMEKNPSLANAALKDLQDFYLKTKGEKLELEVKGNLTAAISEGTIPHLAKIFSEAKACAN